MAIEDKAILLNQLTARLSETVSAAEMNSIMEILSTQLDEYDLIRRSQETYGAPDDCLDAYISAMEIQGRSPKTIERYKYIINRMMAAVQVPTRQITVYHLRQYLANEKARGLCEMTLDGFRQVFSAYFNWLQREGLITANPTANLGAIKCPKRLKQAYTDVDIELLKTACVTVRDKAIVCFLQATGCRISEVTQLNRGDVDLNRLECRVIGKGNKERVVYINAIAGMLVAKYLETRTDDNEALFIGQRRERIQPAGVRAMLKRLEARAGVKNVHPHRFRRTLATELIKHGMPIQEVARILGHEKLDTTMKYVVLDQSSIANTYHRCA